MNRSLVWTLLSTPALSFALGDPGTSGAPLLVWGDFDGDGLSDLVALEASGRVRLHRNLGNGALEDVTEASGVQIS